METRADGRQWFSEYGTMWPGQAMGIEIEKVVIDKKTSYQSLLVADTKTYGKMLCLDGVIQLTDRDEFSYHEMISNLPLFSHPNPKSVLIIGGGDGGALSQVLRHSSVEKADLCDIDEEVTIASKEHFPKFAHVWSDPRVSAYHMDGFKFIADKGEAAYDVIIVDSSDPVGPAEALFEEPFYRALHKSLKPGGVLCTQGECVWLHMELIGEMARFCRGMYEHVEYAWISVPTYPSGSIGFMLCAKEGGDKEENKFRIPTREADEAFEKDCLYYSRDVHRAAFAIPAFAKRAIEASKKQ